MKKKVIAVALLAAMALTGCGSKGFTGEKVVEKITNLVYNFIMITINTIIFRGIIL